MLQPVAPALRETRGLENLNQRAAIMMARRLRARKSLAEFSMAVDIPGKPFSDDEDEWQFHPIETAVAAHHRLIMNAVEAAIYQDNGRVMLMLPPGSAKALALDTPIPTVDGWRRMGDLRVGDRVFDESGRPCNITWVSPIWKNRPVYRLTTDCGDEIIADQDHEWLVRLCGKPRKPLKGTGLGPKPPPNRDDPASQFKIKKTWQLARRRAKRPMIKRAAALDLPDADLPIDPYLLGLWLGDGHSAGMRITAGAEDQIWLRQELSRIGYQTSTAKNGASFGVLGVRDRFVSLGLLNDPWHSIYGRKYIPAIYLRASAPQRLSLLQGLIDSDGTVCRKRGSTTFCNTDLHLAEQVHELARSLGVKASRVDGRATLYGKDCGPVARVSFYMSSSARIPRKAMFCRNQRRTPNTYIDVVPHGYADTACLEVDSPSHLFLAGRSMTPTHNSTYASVVAPPYFMGKHSGFRVIAASYGSDLSRKLGRRARSIVRCDTYGKIFGAFMAEDTRAALEWHLSNGSEYLGGGILSGLGGSRCEFLVIDDPVKNRQDADSKAIKTRTREEFEDTLEPRLVPGGAICLIMTRWAEDDLAGGILPTDWDGESGMISCRDGREWNVVRVPAICDRPDDPLGRKLGEGLWSNWFKPGHWDRFKLVKRTWNSLYQQVPRASDAGFFSREWFSIVSPNEIPRMIKVCRRWDLAASEGEGDFTAGVLMGIDADRNVWILDAVHFQKGPGKAEREMKRVTEQDDSIFKGRCRVVFPREPGAAGKILARHFAIQYAKFDHGFHIESRAKHIRARPLAAGLESGTVFLRAGDWNSILIDELCAFDESISESHGDQIDDLVDAASGAYHELVGRQRSVVGAGPSVG